MLLPYKVDVPMARIPWANWVLIAVTSVVSIGVLLKELHEEQQGFRQQFEMKVPPEVEKKAAELFAQGKREEAFELLQNAMPENEEPETDGFTGALDPHHFALSQLITYQFVHANLIHLIGNMFMLFVFGNAVNAKLGQMAYVASYLVLGVIGGLGWLLLGNGGPMVGASGAIMGVIGVFLVFFPRNDVTVLYGAWGGGGSFELSSYWLILFYMIADLVGLMREQQGVAYIAHVAGALCGAGLALTLAATKTVQSAPYEQNLLEALGVMENEHEQRPKRKKKKKRPIVQRLPEDE